MQYLFSGDILSNGENTWSVYCHYSSSGGHKCCAVQVCLARTDVLVMWLLKFMKGCLKTLFTLRKKGTKATLPLAVPFVPKECTLVSKVHIGTKIGTYHYLNYTYYNFLKGYHPSESFCTIQSVGMYTFNTFMGFKP